ncbi:hypothetical protein [Mycoplasma sp. 1018B]|uniref:hypothetical protein n=1 Tax=Mycoplasma sp. 1018B TaxID=2967302 RepID=UPI00211B88B1|nr:hypothetical protein [Mycoplasma sp. 1018B]UUM18987.1 hypothetical protein NPA14_01450 [Mycoplasma sp. 1018B]
MKLKKNKLFFISASASVLAPISLAVACETQEENNKEKDINSQLEKALKEIEILSKQKSELENKQNDFSLENKTLKSKNTELERQNSQERNRRKKDFDTFKKAYEKFSNHAKEQINKINETILSLSVKYEIDVVKLGSQYPKSLEQEALTKIDELNKLLMSDEADILATSLVINTSLRELYEQLLAEYKALTQLEYILSISSEKQLTNLKANIDNIYTTEVNKGKNLNSTEVFYPSIQTLANEYINTLIKTPTTEETKSSEEEQKLNSTFAGELNKLKTEFEEIYRVTQENLETLATTHSINKDFLGIKYLEDLKAQQAKQIEILEKDVTIENYTHAIKALNVLDAINNNIAHSLTSLNQLDKLLELLTVEQKAQIINNGEANYKKLVEETKKSFPETPEENIYPTIIHIYQGISKEITNYLVENNKQATKEVDQKNTDKSKKTINEDKTLEEITSKETMKTDNSNDQPKEENSPVVITEETSKETAETKKEDNEKQNENSETITPAPSVESKENKSEEITPSDTTSLETTPAEKPQEAKQIIRIGQWYLDELQVRTNAQRQNDLESRTRAISDLINHLKIDIQAVTNYNNITGVEELIKKLNELDSQANWKYVVKEDTNKTAFLYKASKVKIKNFEDQETQEVLAYDNTNFVKNDGAKNSNYNVAPVGVFFETLGNIKNDFTVVASHFIRSRGTTKETENEAKNLVNVMKWFDEKDGTNDDLIFLGNTNVTTTKNHEVFFAELLNANYKALLDTNINTTLSNRTEKQYSNQPDKIFYKGTLVNENTNSFPLFDIVDNKIIKNINSFEEWKAHVDAKRDRPFANNAGYFYNIIAKNSPIYFDLVLDQNDTN